MGKNYSNKKSKYNYHSNKRNYSKGVTLHSGINYYKIVKEINDCIYWNQNLIWHDDAYYLADIIGRNNMNLSNRDRNTLRSLTFIKDKGGFGPATRNDF